MLALLHGGDLGITTIVLILGIILVIVVSIVCGVAYLIDGALKNKSERWKTETGNEPKDNGGVNGGQKRVK